MLGTKCILCSDHNPLVHLRKRRQWGKFSHWIADLEEYKYTVLYIPGKDNVKADMLSLNHASNDQQPQLPFEDKMYTIDNAPGIKQVKREQGVDPVISTTKRLVQNGEPVIQGRVNHIENQLRVENNLLNKSS